MTKLLSIGLCAATLLASGCSRLPDVRGLLPGAVSADPAPAETPVDPTDPCGAQGYTALLGSNLAAVTLPAGLNSRVLRPDQAATTDYIPARLNVEVDADGTIIGLSCG